MPVELEERVRELETTFAQRISTLEEEVSRLSQRTDDEQGAEEVAWWKKIWGTFKNDPEYDEAMRLGREYRESLRPQEEMEA